MSVTGLGNQLFNGDLTIAAASPRGEAKQSELREAARAFESLFVKQLFKNINVASPGKAQSGAQDDFVNNMWRDQLSEQITSGKGLGLADMIVRQLGEPGTPALQRRLSAYVEARPEPTRFNDQGDFVAHLRPHIERAAAELGVSPKILMAQAALETGWGQHLPGDEAGGVSRNLFGIKAHGGWDGPAVTSQTTEFAGGKAVSIEDGFRAYDDFGASVRDYVQFLRDNPRYQKALDHGGSDENFLQGLKFGGYATDPQYVDKVKSVANSPAMQRYWDET